MFHRLRSAPLNAESESTPRTDQPSASSASHRCEPMKPAAPVTSARPSPRGALSRRASSCGDRFVTLPTIDGLSPMWK